MWSKDVQIMALKPRTAVTGEHCNRWNIGMPQVRRELLLFLRKGIARDRGQRELQAETIVQRQHLHMEYMECG